MLSVMGADQSGAPCLLKRLQGVTVICLLTWTSQCFSQGESNTPLSSGAQRSESEQIAQARDAFALGSALARHGQWLDALVAFERSFKLHPHATTLFNIGFCERALGRFTRARKSFRNALEGPQGRPPVEGELATEAQGYLVEVEQRIVRATVVIRQPSLRLTINGRPLEAEVQRPQGGTFYVAGTRDAGPPEMPPVAVFSLLLDPGEQSFVISNDGIDHVVTRQLAPGSAPRIELSVPATPRPKKEESRPAALTLPAIAYGVGAAGVVVGTVFGIATLTNAKALADACPSKGQCPKTARADIDASERNALISNIGFGVGLAGGLVGTWLLITSKPKHAVEEHGASGAVRVTAGVGRLDIAASF